MSASDDTPATPSPAPAASSQPTGPSESCLTNTICAVKEKIRWQTPAWTPSQCRKVADAVSASAKKHDLSPTLLLAVMINESDMNEKAARTYTHADGKVYAKDGGLMGIRCLLDQKDHCTNGDVKGMAWKDLVEPTNNIELGARALAHYRDGGAVMTKTITKLDHGQRVKVTKEVPCDHKNHAFWAHYNHGPRYIDKGYARHYPHRVAVLDHSLAQIMNVDAPELTHGAITMRDPGKRARTPDRPLEPRFKKLCGQIHDSSNASCSALALN